MEEKTKKRIKYNNVILIPTDFSAVCENAIHHGIELAKFLQYKVCILHVIDKKSETQFLTEDPGMRAIEKKLSEYRDLNNDPASVKIETMIREGNIFKVIGQVALEIKANLMVMGTHGKQGLQHLFGSHALKVVLDSPCPVVVVQQRSFGKGYHNIVLPISSEIEPRQAVEWVLLMCRLFHSKVLIYQSHETDASLNKRLNIITSQITEIFKENKILFEIKVAEKAADFSSQVISYAVINHSDLIMIMTMPAVDLTGFSFSAWDERMMFNEAQIPVMCINPIELGDYYYEWMR